MDGSVLACTLRRVGREWLKVGQPFAVWTRSFVVYTRRRLLCEENIRKAHNPWALPLPPLGFS